MNDIALSSLAPNVAIVAIFIFYLIKKDKVMEEIFNKLSSRLDQLSKVITALEDRLKSIEKTRKLERE